MFRKNQKSLFIDLWTILLILVPMMFFACAQMQIQRKYYLLDYPGVAQDSLMFNKPPFPYKLQVQTMKLNRTYDRTNIVVRFSAHQIDYYRYSLWAIKPQIIISDLINQQIQANRIFIKCEREFLDENPDYEVIGYINSIERFHNEAFNAAHLAMTLNLRRSDDFEIILKHQFDRQEELSNPDMTYFAKKMGDILREEVDKFLPLIVNYFNKLNTGSELRIPD
ncbi:membrane integrity-associated transporter subunit PqiC [candidate division KSB1 bacterium]|nr:membrane integrity-associated transporter subunit PqiC [candidate division KSB1 bacterium]